MSVAASRSEELRTAVTELQGQAWYDLAERVRSFRPDVVILVARKMPRLAEYFHLEFGDRSLVLTDLAIPFAHRFLSGSRVAVVDDAVNVGSTLQHAHDCVVACGAAAVQLFAMSRRDVDQTISVSVDYVSSTPLGDQEYESLVAQVPETLSSLAKPYDLEFPTIPCRFAPPFRDVSLLHRWLCDRYGPEVVHDLTTVSQMPRLTLDKHRGNEGNNKLRFYLDEAELICNVVPFAIPSDLQQQAPVRNSQVARLLEDLHEPLASCPADAVLWNNEASCRARLFCYSLDFGLSALGDLGDILILDEPCGYNIEDAELLFGPVARSSARIMSSLELADADTRLESTDAEHPCNHSPFLARCCAFEDGAFLDRVRDASAASDVASLFAALFDRVALLVGATDPGSYSLDWPFSREEVRERPYLRLRVGPTFGDLVELMGELNSQTWHDVLPMPNLVSTILDYAIDSGAVVPTLTCYDGCLCRIYRQGESRLRNMAVDRALYAWRNSRKRMSLTRFAKLNAVLAYSSQLPPVMLVQSLLRGNVVTLQNTCLDEERGTELSHYLRDTGRLHPVAGGGDAD